MAITKKDLNDERKAHAETKVKLEEALKTIEDLKASLKSKVSTEKVRYVKVPDLTQVSPEQIKEAYEGLT